MRISRLIMIIGLFCIATSSLVSARSILERKVFYLTSDSKRGEAKFWTLFLGNYDCTLNRKFPGEPMQQVNASINLSMVSSGYIEGNGYSSKGRIDCQPTMIIKTDAGERDISIDSIECIFDYGLKIRTISGQVGELVINLEGQKLSPRKFLLREYKLVNLYGEEVLKEGSTEILLSAIAFTKEGLQNAAKQATPAPAPKPSAPPAKPAASE